MSSEIERLPDEVVDLIERNSSRKDFLSLRKTSQRFHRYPQKIISFRQILYTLIKIELLSEPLFEEDLELNSALLVNDVIVFDPTFDMYIVNPQKRHVLQRYIESKYLPREHIVLEFSEPSYDVLIRENITETKKYEFKKNITLRTLLSFIFPRVPSGLLSGKPTIVFDHEKLIISWL